MTSVAILIARRRSRPAARQTFVVRRLVSAAADVAALGVALFVVYFFHAFIPRTRA
jgi:hypothetical protein